jgi:hypothetical protein
MDCTGVTTFSLSGQDSCRAWIAGDSKTAMISSARGECGRGVSPHGLRLSGNSSAFLMVCLSKWIDRRISKRFMSLDCSYRSGDVQNACP